MSCCSYNIYDSPLSKHQLLFIVSCCSWYRSKQIGALKHVSPPHCSYYKTLAHGRRICWVLGSPIEDRQRRWPPPWRHRENCWNDSPMSIDIWRCLLKNKGENTCWVDGKWGKKARKVVNCVEFGGFSHGSTSGWSHGIWVFRRKYGGTVQYLSVSQWKSWTKRISCFILVRWLAPMACLYPRDLLSTYHFFPVVVRKPRADLAKNERVPPPRQALEMGGSAIDPAKKSAYVSRLYVDEKAIQAWNTSVYGSWWVISPSISIGFVQMVQDSSHQEY